MLQKENLVYSSSRLRKQKMKMASKLKTTTKNEVDHPNKYAPKNEDNKNEDDRGLRLLFMKFAFTTLSQLAIVFVTLSSFFIYFSKMVDLMKIDG